MITDNLGFGPTEIDTAVNDFISSAQKEFEVTPDEALEAPAPLESGQETNSAEAPNTPVAPAPEAPKPEDPTERGLERLIAREMELRERETALGRQKAEMEAYSARIKELEARVLPEDIFNKIRLSPNEGLRALGLDPDEVVRTALAEKLGDKAPPEVKDLMEKTRLRREMEALKAQVQEAERRQAAQAYYAQVANGAREFLGKSEEISKHSPTVAHVAKSNPDRVHQEIMEEITRDAQVRAAREPNGNVMSYEDAAKRVEARWSAMKSLLVPASAAPVAASTPQVADTKQNVAKANTNSPPSTIKPPEKPLAPWLQTSKSEEDAIRMAIDEWRRAESEKAR